MRIPSHRVHNSMIHALSRTMGRMQRVQVEMATGKRLLKPSDDPAGTVQVLSLQRALGENQQYQRNIADGLRWVASAEAVLTDLTEILTKIKEITIRGGSAECGSDRVALGADIDALLNEIIDLSKSQMDGRYLFSGFATSAVPIETSVEVENETLTAAAAGVAVDLTHARIVEGSVVVTDIAGTTTFVEGVDYSIDYSTGRLTVLGGGSMAEGVGYSVSYQTTTVSSVEAAGSSEGEIRRQIGPDRTVPVNLLCPEVFQGGVDIFQLAIDLKNALWKDDADRVQSLLASVSSAVDQATEKLGVVGTWAQILETQQLHLESDEIALEGFISEIEDLDLASAVVRLQAEQIAYESALAATARLMQISIVNYL